MQEVITAWRYDHEGWLEKETVAQFIEELGRYNVPDGCTTTEPEYRAGFWLKFDEANQTWSYHKIPTTPDECVALGMVKHKGQTAHEAECMHLIQTVCEGSTTHRVLRGPDLEWYVEKIPELTSDEKALKAAQEKKSQAEANLSSTDYVAAKIAEGAATREEYATVLAQRQAWRDEVNAADAEIKALEAKGVKNA